MDESLKNAMQEEFRIRNRSQGTCKLYLYHINRFLEWTGNKPLSNLTLSDAREYLIYKLDEGLTAASCNAIGSALGFLYRYILHINWDYNIIPRMKRDWHLPSLLSREDIEKLIDTADNIRDKALIALIYSSGLRVSEVCRLAPTDIYMSSMQVHIRDSKNRGDHWTVLSERALELLKAYWRSCPEPRDLLFVSLRKPHTPIKTGAIQVMLRKLGAKAGVNAGSNVHPHMLRHSFATHLIEDSTLREFVQAMLGHRSPNSTTVYINVSNKTLMGVQSPFDRKRSETDKKTRKRKSSIEKNGAWNNA